PAGPAPTCTGPPGWPVAGSIRWTVPSSPLATQTAPAPAAMPSGRAPTWIPRFVTAPVTAAIRSTVPSPSLTTHTAPLPAAMATGRLPTWIVSTTLSVTVLTRDTVPSPLLVTHASGPVTATALGADPTGICCTAWVAGSIRASAPSALPTAHTDPAP